MISFFKELFEYNNHFNQKLADVFNEKSDKISERSITLFSHLLNAHQIWNNRIDPVKLPFGVWQVNPVAELKIIENENYKQTLQILTKVELDLSIEYSNSKDEAFCSSIRDIYFHVINHSTHHRAQIASELRQSGLEPLVTDYIFYKRTVR